MSATAIPYGETVNFCSSNKSISYAGTKFYGRRSPLSEQCSREKNKNDSRRFLSPVLCDPLLDSINLNDFEDDEKLQRNFEEILRIHKMGFPVKIVKQNWFPGLICIPIFHCRRCLAMWTHAAQIPSLCSEVNRNVCGRLIPISITKCDLVTRLLGQDQKQTARPLCKKFSVNKPVEPVLSMKENLQDESRKTLKLIPVAEFVDINEQLRKYRRKFSSKLKRASSEASGRIGDGRGLVNTPVSEYGSEAKLPKVEIIDRKSQKGIAEMEDKIMEDGCKNSYGRIDSNFAMSAAYDEENGGTDEDTRFNPKSKNVRIHDISCCAKPGKDGYARPSRSQGKHGLEKGLAITSENKAVKTKDEREKTSKLVPQQMAQMKWPAQNQLSNSRKSTSPGVTQGSAYENRLAELRQKTLACDKRALKAVTFERKVDVVLGDDENEQTVVNPGKFRQSLDEEIGKQEKKLRGYKRELTRAFCFSYFELLRRNNEA